MKPRVFISSTFIDLHEHRKALLSALDGDSGSAAAMELFGARSGAPKEECLGEVRKAHVFTLVLGMRYGAIDHDSGLSLTHLEYIEAQRLNTPTLVYLIDEDRHRVLPKDVELGESAVKLRSLKEVVSKAHIFVRFESVEDLRRKFVQDLASLVQREKIGIDSRELESLVSKLPRVNWLNDERLDFLVKEIGELAAAYTKRLVLKEVLDFILAGDRHSAVFLTSKHTRFDIRKSIDLCFNIESKIAEVVARGNTIINEKRG
jgi:hypothetical protein